MSKPKKRTETIHVTLRLDARLYRLLRERAAGGGVNLLMRRLLAQGLGRPELAAVNPRGWAPGRPRGTVS